MDKNREMNDKKNTRTQHPIGKSRETKEKTGNTKQFNKE